VSDSALAAVADRLGPTRERRLPWHDSPARFAREAVSWPTGESLAPYQADVLDAMASHGRVAVRSPRGAGKTTTTALLVLHHAISRDHAGIGWKVVTTAASWRQLERFTWPEIHAWARRIRWDVVGRPPFDPRTELSGHTLKLRHGQAFAVSVDDAQLIEGGHAQSMLLVLDEAKAIPSSVWDSVEGSLATPGEHLVLATSTPGAPSGRFYEIFERRPGLLDWHTESIGLEDAIAAGRVSREWAEQRGLQWGRTSAAYANHVLGAFADSDEDGTIPLSWVEAACERWRDWAEAGRPQSDESAVIGVDVGRGGDKTVLAVRRGDVVEYLERHNVPDVMAVTGHVSAKMGTAGTAVVDVIGIGAGVVDRLREMKRNVVAFNASERSTGKDRSGELGFLNMRSAAWWRMRESLDPANDAKLALPPDDELVGDLCAPKWKVNSSGRIQVEGKDEIRKRLGRSPDAGDAVVMSLGLPARRRRRSRMTTLSRAESRARAARAANVNDPKVESSSQRS